MTKAEKIAFRRRFFKLGGPNLEACAMLFNRSNDVGFYIKDKDGRIVALNRRNLEICNIADELDAVGMRSCDLFSADKAASYMESDRDVMRTGKPLRDVVSQYPADDSRRFELRDVYPLRSASGKLIGTMCAYQLTSESDMSTDRYRNLRDVSDYIQRHYGEHIGIEQLIRVARMSESSLTRAFKKVFSTTPGRYLVITRLNAARKLLEETDKTLSEIAQDCGFNDQSHFCHVFKADRKMTPSEYRQNHWNSRSNA